MSRQGASNPGCEPPSDARGRVFIERVAPTVDGGRYPIKRVVGDSLEVTVDLVCDGHERLAGVLQARAADETDWREQPLEALGDDRWAASVTLDALGRWTFRILAWIDDFTTWLQALERKVEADQDVTLELAEGALLVSAAADRAEGADAETLKAAAAVLADARRSVATRIQEARAPLLLQRMARWPDRALASCSVEYPVIVDPPHARSSAWYELFPRSFGPPGRHGTFADVERVLPYVAQMGFDTLYLPPIHPIGVRHRKGRNNALVAGEGDPGSPWAIGNASGGHTSVHPDLGTLEDFDRFVEAAKRHGLRLALDIAFQCSPDHPWVTEHPQWFRRRPDGSIQYAENPPKKYQDVYPFDFRTEDWKRLWCALRDVFLFWADRGIRVFRVDNPHTKPLSFWEWCLAEVKTVHPDAIFLAEAFTRPKLMYTLAKVGFSQSYTYFTWRSSSWELRTYVEELAQPEVADVFRPNFWPNTPDILPEELQWGGRPAFVTRLVLAATLAGNYGIYGPAFELMESEARPGSGEYIDNEKYQLRSWDLDRKDSLRGLIARVNRIRRESPALQRFSNVQFHATDNERLLCYSKRADGDTLVVVVNLDHHHRQSGWIDLDLRALDIPEDETYQAHDLLGEGRFAWSGARNYVDLDPHALPAQIFRIRRRIRTERDFDYFV